MQIVSPASAGGTSEPLPSACSKIQRNAAVRSALKFTNGPAAVADASKGVGTNIVATCFATSAGERFIAFAAAKQPTAKSPSSARGGASTLRSAAGAPVIVATASTAARAKGLWAEGIARLYSAADRSPKPVANPSS